MIIMTILQCFVYLADLLKHKAVVCEKNALFLTKRQALKCLSLCFKYLTKYLIKRQALKCSMFQGVTSGSKMCEFFCLDAFFLFCFTQRKFVYMIFLSIFLQRQKALPFLHNSISSFLSFSGRFLPIISLTAHYISLKRGTLFVLSQFLSSSLWPSSIAQERRLTR